MYNDTHMFVLSPICLPMVKSLLLMVKLFAVVSCLTFHKASVQWSAVLKFQGGLRKGEGGLFPFSSCIPFLLRQCPCITIYVWSQNGQHYQRKPRDAVINQAFGTASFLQSDVLKSLKAIRSRVCLWPPNEGGGRRPNPVEPSIDRVLHQRLQHLPCYIRIGSQCNDVKSYDLSQVMCFSFVMNMRGLWLMGAMAYSVSSLKG